MARVIFLWLLLTLLYFLLHNSMVHQWQQPVLIYPEADNTFWLLHLLNIPQFIMRSPVNSVVFDFIFITSVMLFLVFPRRTVLAWISVICFWLFQIMFGSANGHHYHHIGYLLVPLPFIFRNQLKFYFAWNIIRYWILFLFVCSALYKLYYGGFFHTDNMSLILRQDFYPGDDLRSRIIFYLVDHPSISQFFYQGATIMQLACVIGFFTRKNDGLIFFLLLVFNVFNYFLLNFPFWENSLVLAPFADWERLGTLFHSVKKRVLNGRTKISA